MRRIKTTWFTTNSGLIIGIVIGRDEITNEKKAYMDIASGNDNENDQKFIAEFGQKLPFSFIEELYNDMKPDGQ